VKITLPITTEKELDAFVTHILGLKIPKKRVCEGHCSPWDAFSSSFFARSPVSVWWSSRGFGGKTTLLAALALAEGVAYGADVSVLGGSYQQSQHIRRYIEKFIQRPDLRGWADVLTEGRVRLRNEAEITALAASQTSVRGPHPQRLRMDEIDEMPLDILDAAMGQPMSSETCPAQVVLSSTWQYPNSTMAEVLKRAGERSWPVFAWCYKETLKPAGWLSQSDVDRKKLTVSSGMWSVEYDLQTPSYENRAILPEAVEAMFKRELGEFEGSPGQIIEAEPPDPNGIYVHGCDLARKRDMTVLITLRVDVRPMRLVSFFRLNRLPWSIMMSKISERVRRYPGPLCFDQTGVGDAAGEFLDVMAEGVLMVGRARTDLLAHYITCCEKGMIEAPLIHVMKAEHLYASIDDLYGAGHLPDTFAAGALAARKAIGQQTAEAWIRALAAENAPSDDPTRQPGYDPVFQMVRGTTGPGTFSTPWRMG